MAFFVCECEELLGGYSLDDWFDRGETTAIAVVGELDPAIDLGEERVVRTDAHVQAWLDACATLTHDDGSAGDDLTAKSLDAKPLRIRIPSVCGAASTLLMCHC